MPDARWIFSKDGKPAFYRVADDIFTPNGSRQYWISETWWHSSSGPTYYESDDWIFSKDGKPTFYYGN
jgi:hypothetical protein